MEEGSAASAQFKEDDSECPPVNSLIVVALHKLRCEVLWSATDLLDLLVRKDLCSQAKVDDFDVTIGVKHDIVKFEIAMDEIVLM